MTEKLTAFFSKLRPWPLRRHAWLGDVSSIRQSHRPLEIARRAGLAPDPDAFVSITGKTAAQVMAYVQSESLAYGTMKYRESIYRDCRDMVAELGEGATFWSNSSYEGSFMGESVSAHGWRPITSSVFDTGVAGCSRDVGFIFWMEEND
jgi:hypothetical protein